MSTTYRAMCPGDLEKVLQLWRATEGIGLSETDSLDQLERFLKRNPDLSHVALENGELIGAVLCGHDGRRGYLHHLAVAESQQRQGIGTALVASCLDSLRAVGITKCHLFIFNDNEDGKAFWRHNGWTRRDELAMMSIWM